MENQMPKLADDFVYNIHRIDDYNTFKWILNEINLYWERVNLKDLEILDKNTVAFGGREYFITYDAWSELLECLSLKSKILDKLRDIKQDSDIEFLNIIKRAFSKNGKMSVVVYPDKYGRIAHITSDVKVEKAVSNGTFLNFLDMFLEKDDLRFSSVSVNSGGDYSVQLLQNKPIGLDSYPDEMFNFGISLENTFARGMSIVPYNFRLVCLNGMTTKNVISSHHLKRNSKEKAYAKFYSEVSEMLSSNYYKDVFLKKYKTAVETPASLNEMETASKILKGAGMDSNLVNEYLPLKMHYDYYEQKGYPNPNKLQKRLARTNMTLHEVVNVVTNLASHKGILDSSSDVRKKMKDDAGEMVMRGADLAQLEIARL